MSFRQEPRAGQVWHESCTDTYGYTVVILSKHRKLSRGGNTTFCALVTFPDGTVMLDKDCIVGGEAVGNTRIV